MDEHVDRHAAEPIEERRELVIPEHVTAAALNGGKLLKKQADAAEELLLVTDVHLGPVVEKGPRGRPCDARRVGDDGLVYDRMEGFYTVAPETESG